MVDFIDTEWKLHKTYLAQVYKITYLQVILIVLSRDNNTLQSEYFSSMFNGQWKESSENIITLEIPDPNIDREGM